MYVHLFVCCVPTIETNVVTQVILDIKLLP